MPIDEDELDRIDLKHRLYTLLLGEKYFLAPIGRNPQRILDLGTGSGRKRLFPTLKPTKLATFDRYMGNRHGRRIPVG